MLTFSKLDSSTLSNIGKRILKVLQFGAKTASECSPFGIDANPIKGMTAVYGDTSNNGDTVVLGYIQKNQLAQEGETRFFSLDSSGNLKAFIWLKNDGDIQLNGDQFSSVRFQPLKSGIDTKDSLINTELSKIATAIGTLGGTYVPANISTNISQSESETVKIL